MDSLYVSIDRLRSLISDMSGIKSAPITYTSTVFKLNAYTKLNENMYW